VHWKVRYGSKNQEMHVSVWRRIINILKFLRISVTYVAILREVHYRDGYIDILQTFVNYYPDVKYYILKMHGLNMYWNLK
jgi:hypothetical protein